MMFLELKVCFRGPRAEISNTGVNFAHSNFFNRERFFDWFNHRNIKKSSFFFKQGYIYSCVDSILKPEKVR